MIDRRTSRALRILIFATTLALGACGNGSEAAVATAALDVSDCPPGSNVIVGTDGDDVIYGTAGPDCIFGYGGDDTIHGGDGDDFVVGGDGADTVIGGNGADVIYGDDGDDTIAGGNGPDVIHGGPGNDIISGDNGPDTIEGGDGNDVILDSRGPSTVDPGSGTDSCSAPGCELPPATRCAASSDCGADQSCIGGACVYCQADTECDDGLVCTGVESCVPVTGCQGGADPPFGHDLGTACTNGIGACERSGTHVCDGSGGFLCNAVPGTPTPDEDCDLVDDDCDALTDEAFVPTSITCGVGGCVASGVTSCGPSGEVDICTPLPPGVETCDGIDNDCNGVVDDGGLLDSDGDTLCDAAPGVEPSTAIFGGTPDACPFHADITVTTPGDIVTGTMLTFTNGATAAMPIPYVTVWTGIDDGRRITSDCRGRYTYVVPTGSAAINSDDIRVDFHFNSTVPGPGGITSLARVVDDLGHPWGTDDFHGFPNHDGYSRTATSAVTTDASGRRTRTVSPITLDTSESELSRIAVMVVDDFQRATLMSVPNGNLSYMRRAGFFSDIAVPYASYDYVDLVSNVLTLGSMDTTAKREDTLFHESGHVFRHVLDGDRSHWDGDLFRFIYGRCHTGREIFAEGFAFNEGWAEYWRRARWFDGVPERIANPTPSSFVDRPFPVVKVVPPAPTTPPTVPDVTDYCDGTIGTEGVPFESTHVDWVENMVTDRLIQLANACAGPTPDMADAAMIGVLAANRGRIHTLFEFETALCAAGLCCGMIRTTPPLDCPPGFHDDGESCSRDGQIIPEP